MYLYDSLLATTGIWQQFAKFQNFFLLFFVFYFLLRKNTLFTPGTAYPKARVVMSSRRRQGGVKVPEVVGSNQKVDDNEPDSPVKIMTRPQKPPVSPEAEESSVKDGSGRKPDRSPRVDRSDPAFVPTNGQFFLHDNRAGKRGGRGNSNQEDDDRNRYAWPKTLSLGICL